MKGKKMKGWKRKEGWKGEDLEWFILVQKWSQVFYILYIINFPFITLVLMFPSYKKVRLQVFFEYKSICINTISHFLYEETLTQSAVMWCRFDWDTEDVLLTLTDPGRPSVFESSRFNPPSPDRKQDESSDVSSGYTNEPWGLDSRTHTRWKHQLFANSTLLKVFSGQEMDSERRWAQ